MSKHAAGREPGRAGPPLRVRRRRHGWAEEPEPDDPGRVLQHALVEPDGVTGVLTHADAASRSAVVGAMQHRAGNRAVQRLLTRAPGPAGAPGPVTVQRAPRGTVTLGEEEASVATALPQRQGTTIEQFQAIYQIVQQAAVGGQLVGPAPREEFVESRENLQDLADWCHNIDEHWRREATRGLGTNKYLMEFAEQAARDVGVYEQLGVDVRLAETATLGWWGMLEMSEASWVRLAANAQQNGVNLMDTDIAPTDVGPRGVQEKELNEPAMQERAQALKGLVAAADTGYLQGSRLQGTVKEYENAWQEVITAQAAAVGALVADRRVANQKRDDAEERQLADIKRIIKVADQVGGLIETTMGNLAAVRAHMAALQPSGDPRLQFNDETGAIEAVAGEVTGIDRKKLKELMAGHGKAATGKLGTFVEFVFSEEIDRCNAAIQAVEAHDEAFSRVIEKTESVAKTRALKDKLSNLQTKGQNAVDEANTLRQAHLQFGENVDKALQASGQLKRGQELAVSGMMDLALLRECATYTMAARTGADEVLRHLRGLRDALYAIHHSERGNRLLTQVASSRLVWGEEERYGRAAQAIFLLQRLLVRREQHVTALSGTFFEALGKRGSSTGENRW